MQCFYGKMLVKGKIIMGDSLEKNILDGIPVILEKSIQKSLMPRLSNVDRARAVGLGTLSLISILQYLTNDG